MAGWRAPPAAVYGSPCHQGPAASGSLRKTLQAGEQASAQRFMASAVLLLQLPRFPPLRAER